MSHHPHRTISISRGAKIRGCVRSFVAGLYLFPAFGAGLLQAAPAVKLSAEEVAYVSRSHEVPVRMCVDPDWRPFEWLEEDGSHEGIAADLIRLVAERTGLRIDVHPTSNWSETLKASRAGRCQILSFVNQTPERDAWLIYTEPLLVDLNVIVAHRRHPDVPDPSSLHNETVALPAGTMVIERMAREYPDLHVIPAESERHALSLVVNGVADFTVRSMIVAAYTIRSEGLTDLKIAGRMPDFGNKLRIAVVKEERLLRDILDKGIGTLSDAERDLIVNRHAGRTFEWQVDYRLAAEVALVALLVGIGLLLRQRQIRRLNAVRLEYVGRQLEAQRRGRQEESRLVAMLSHEVKTPLAMINGAAQALELLVQDAEPDVTRRIDRIRRGVSRLDALTRQFLDKDALEARSLRPDRVQFDLGALIEEVIAELGAEQRVQVIAKPPRPVCGDPALLQLAIRNLIHNALKYTQAETAIQVSAGIDGGRAYVRVRDEGPGIPPQLRQKVFNSYVRGDHSSSIPGAGLGLYIVGRVAEVHGGEVRLGHPTRGAEFIIEWPDSTA